MVHSRLNKNNNQLETNVISMSPSSSLSSSSYHERPISMYDNLNPMTIEIEKVTGTGIETGRKDTTTQSTYSNVTPSYPGKILSYNLKCNGEQRITTNAGIGEEPTNHKNGPVKKELIGDCNNVWQQRSPSSLDDDDDMMMGMMNNNDNRPQGNHHPNHHHHHTEVVEGKSSNSSSKRLQPAAAVPLGQTTQLGRPQSDGGGDPIEETTSASLAAVKAALNEAKSKFFGLQCSHDHDDDDDNQRLARGNDVSNVVDNVGHHDNGDRPWQPLIAIIGNHHHHGGGDDHQQRSNHSTNYSSTHPRQHHEMGKLLFVKNDDDDSDQPPQQMARIQPRYQNIPENSAIYRNYLSECSGSVGGGGDGGGGGGGNTKLTSQSMEVNSTNVEMQKNHNECNTRNNNNNNNNKSTDFIISKHGGNMSEGGMIKTMGHKTNPIQEIIGASQPSQAVYMTTTVPQNIKGSKIAGRHTPTRSSLRHSRMLVVNNKSFQEVYRGNAMGFQQPCLVRSLLILQIIFGILLIALSIWMFLLAPNTVSLDNPYWSGLFLLTAGILGLILLRYQLPKRHKIREHCFVFLRINSYIVSVLALFLCLLALIFVSLHYIRLTASNTRCQSSNILMIQGSCICTFNLPMHNDKNSSITSTVNSSRIAMEEEEDVDDESYQFEYRDLSCPEVSGIWLTILQFSISFNTIGTMITLIYVLLLICCRHNYQERYTSVQTSTF